jgi:hypothetical protein
MPQSQSQQRHYQQKAYAQDRKSPLKVEQVGIVKPYHGLVLTPSAHFVAR